MAAPNSTSRTADSGGSSFHSSGAPTMFQAAVISAGATISSTALAPASTRSRTGAIAWSMSGKWIQAVVVRAGSGTVSKTSLGEEGERALGADDEAAEDLQRLVGVEEGAEPVAGRVLDLELAADARAQLLVGADLVADLGQPGGQLRLGLGEALVGAGGGGVDRRPRGQDEGHRPDRRVGVAGDAAAHAAGVVGDDAADRGDVGAGRVGAEFAPVRGEDAVGVAEHGAGLDPGYRAVLLDRDAGEVAAHVDEDAVALALAVEAGAAGAEGDRDPLLATVGEDLGDVAGLARHHHRLGEEPVGAGVGGVADDVGGAGQQPAGAEQRFQLAAQGLGDAGGDLVGSAIGCRLVDLGGERLRLAL